MITLTAATSSYCFNWSSFWRAEPDAIKELLYSLDAQSTMSVHCR